MEETGSSLSTNHPYWPRNLTLPTYVPNDRSMTEILVFLFSVSGVLLLSIWVLTGKQVAGRQLSAGRRLTLCWFTVCGFIHGVIEGWFALFYPVIVSDQSFLSQLCKSNWCHIILLFSKKSIVNIITTLHFKYTPQGKNMVKGTAGTWCKCYVVSTVTHSICILDINANHIQCTPRTSCIVNGNQYRNCSDIMSVSPELITSQSAWRQ